MSCQSVLAALSQICRMTTLLSYYNWTCLKNDSPTILGVLSDTLHHWLLLGFFSLAINRPDSSASHSARYHACIHIGQVCYGLDFWHGLWCISFSFWLMCLLYAIDNCLSHADWWWTHLANWLLTDELIDSISNDSSLDLSLTDTCTITKHWLIQSVSLTQILSHTSSLVL